MTLRRTCHPRRPTGCPPPPVPAEPTPATAPTTAFVVSLHALAGIRHERTMLLPVMIHGERRGFEPRFPRPIFLSS
jgi:hypothetical protein